MIVNCAVYRRGVRVAETMSVEEALAASRAWGAFAWIGLHEPIDAEFEAVRREFSLHELAVEDAIHAHQRPKLEVYDGTLFVVLRTARCDDASESVEFGEILVFVGEKFVITVRHGAASPLDGLRRDLEAHPELLRRGPGQVLHAIVDRVVDDYQPVIAGIEDDIEEVEEAVFSEALDHPVERIYYLKREILSFHRATRPLLEPLARLSNEPFPVVPAATRPFFRDAHDHLLRVVERIEAAREVLTTVLSAHLARVGIRQNEDMRKISAVVAIIAVPTAIASVYGMNFAHLPGLHSKGALYLVLGVMAGSIAALYAGFRRSGWL